MLLTGCSLHATAGVSDAVGSLPLRAFFCFGAPEPSEPCQPSHTRAHTPCLLIKTTNKGMQQRYPPWKRPHCRRAPRYCRR